MAGRCCEGAAAGARYAVIGHPVAHSRSPWIHARFAEQTGQALTYTAIESREDAFAPTLARERAAGLAGANVTVPFKLQAWSLADVRSARATLAQAANTLAWRSDADGAVRLHADNTDGIGLVRDLTLHAGRVLTGQRVLLLGAGGAAAGVLGELIAQRPASVTLANRTSERAQALRKRHAAWAAQHGVALHVVRFDAVLADAALGAVRPEVASAADPTDATDATDARSRGAQAEGAAPDAFDLVLNATSSSLGGAVLALPARRFAAGSLACDLMYGAAAQPFLRHAAACGATPRDGLGMLVEQAAESFALWRGVRPDTTPVLHALREQVDGAGAPRP